ncbi:hypothetical protein EON66_05615 [archaeon]|nr:MAG: hypothetical protein EON66_05615 [archaeon]
MQPDAHAAAAGDAAMRALPDVDVAPDARAPDAATMAQLEAGVDATSPTMLILNSGMPATVENTSLATSVASGSASDAITAPPPSGSTNLHVLSEGVIAEDVIGATTPATA